MEELSVSGIDVSGADGSFVTVTGTASPEGATVTVSIRMADGSTGQASGTVANGMFSVQVPVQSAPGSNGRASITITDPAHFGLLEGASYKNFKL
jgi:hypothetical protein